MPAGRLSADELEVREDFLRNYFRTVNPTASYVDVSAVMVKAFGSRPRGSIVYRIRAEVQEQLKAEGIALPVPVKKKVFVMPQTIRVKVPEAQRDGVRSMIEALNKAGVSNLRVSDETPEDVVIVSS